MRTKRLRAHISLIHTHTHTNRMAAAVASTGRASCAYVCRYWRWNIFSYLQTEWTGERISWKTLLKMHNKNCRAISHLSLAGFRFLCASCVDAFSRFRFYLPFLIFCSSSAHISRILYFSVAFVVDSIYVASTFNTFGVLLGARLLCGMVAAWFEYPFALFRCVRARECAVCNNGMEKNACNQ